jgi:allantoate deiminase
MLSECAQKCASRLLQRCEILAQLSSDHQAVTRLHLTKEHQQANQLTIQWMQQAGLICWQDAAGNVWGRYESPQAEAKRLVIGSHLDTVPNAGKYDGILGVLSAIELIEWFHKQSKTFPFHIDVVGFADEEGARFGVTLIGSKAVAGEFSNDWLSAKDRDGISLAEAYEHFGLDPNAVPQAAISADSLLGYLETHIEQGPVLESLEEPVGLVTGIAGAKRANIEFTGMAGHAGTTPMHLRQDALLAAAKAVVVIEQLAQQCVQGEVATVGQISAQPGATNVIASGARISLDVRALNDDHRDALIQRIRDKIENTCTQHGVTMTWQWTHSASAVLCDKPLQQCIIDSAAQLEQNLPQLPSGAGHDAMAIASIAPVAMLFIRSPGGISHNPRESVIDSDVAIALQLMCVTLINLAKQI